MFRFVAFVLLAGAHAQTTTPATTVTTTPATTVTTTPGSTVQVSTTMTQGNRRLLVNGRKLSSGFSATQVTAAFCAALRDISPACSNAVATLSSSDVWSISAYFTTTVANAETLQSAISGLTQQTMTTRMISGFATLGITVTTTDISLTDPTQTVVAAQPYVASSIPSYASPAFDVTFNFVSDNAAVYLATNTSTIWHNAVVAAFAGINISSAGVNMIETAHNYSEGSFTGATNWLVGSANCTISVVESAVNTTFAVLQFLQTNQNTFGALITTELQKVTTYSGLTFAITTSAFTVNAMPTGASATGISITINGVTGVGTRLFDVDDDAQEHDEIHEPAAAAASWTLPILGVFGLLSLVTLIGMGVRRRQPSRRSYTPCVAEEELCREEDMPLTENASP